MGRVLRFIDSELLQASQGELPYPVPVLLQRIGKLHKKQPSLRADIWRKGRLRAIKQLMQQQCQNVSVHSNELAVSQLASAQANIGLYEAKLWQHLARQQFVFNDFLSAVTTVHAYGSLYDSKAAPPGTQELQNVLLTAAEQHFEHQNALGLSNACWSLAKLQMPGWDRQWPLAQQAFARVCQNPKDMHPEEVACIAYALGVARKPLGCAHEPFIAAVETCASKMNAKQVSRTLRAFATLGMSPGQAYSGLIRAVERELCSDTVLKAVIPYQVMTFVAFSRSKLPVCSAHESLVCTLKRSIDHMTPPFVVATLLACGEMIEMKGPYQTLAQPLCRPLLDALALSGDRLDVRGQEMHFLQHQRLT